MSQAGNCDCPCPDPVITEIPGSPAEPCEPCEDGSPGINAFTVLTADLILPGAAGPVVAATSVGVSSWAGIGQVIFISDGTDWGHFRVLTIPSSTTMTLEWLDYPDDAAAGSTIGTGGTVSPSGVLAAGPFTIPEGGTGGTTATTARAALGVGGANLSVYAAGTAYQLTATPALIDFGTTDPSLTITAPGVWLILARARVDYNGATFAASQTGTIKLRRTNNTAADIANSSGSFLTDIITTLSYTLDVLDLAPIIYTTTNSNDIIQLWGSVGVIPSAGSLDVSEASIVAVKLFDQTV